MGKLTAKEVAKLRKQLGFHPDGGGLYLRVKQNKRGERSASWIYRYKRCDLGLGPLDSVSLAQARQKAADGRKQRLENIDPIAAKRAAQAAETLEKARAISFDECVELFLAPREKGWKNAKHRQQWQSTLKTYASPAFGRVPVADVNTSLVLKAIEPIWLSKPETASRLRGRIERILSWAKVRGYRTGENPALWRGHLDQTLPPPNKGKRHHKALPYTELPAFLIELRSRPATAARALEFVILTAARTGEVIGVTWEEIDLGIKTWVVPAPRMKAERAHIVPLSDAAMAVLGRIEGPRTGPIFWEECSGQPLSNMSMLMLLRRMRCTDVTTHGFRSTFRDWVAEQTDFADPIAEAALAHESGDATERAYRRSTFLAKRRRLMDAWGEFCAGKPISADILPLKRF